MAELRNSQPHTGVSWAKHGSESRPMNICRFASIALMICAAHASFAQQRALTEVYRDNNFQFTGVTVSRTGRIFLNFPRWSDRYLNAVVELQPDGSTRPYPDEPWNRWDGKQATAPQAFVCVQSVVVDDTDALWVLDPAAPMLGPVVTGGPKLVQVDLTTNRVARIIRFGSDVVQPNSYLNDVRFDTGNGFAYITDSGVGGIVVVNLATGAARRMLDNHPSVLAQPNVDIVINEKPVRDITGKVPQFNSDGIALSPDRQYLYYQALTGNTLYRVRTSVLRDPSARQEQVDAAIERVAQTFPVDGLWIDPQNRLYLTGITQNAVFRLEPAGNTVTLASDPRLQWPDTFSQGPDGSLYVTTSRIHETPRYNQGRDVRTGPFTLFRLAP